MTKKSIFTSSTSDMEKRVSRTFLAGTTMENWHVDIASRRSLGLCRLDKALKSLCCTV